MFVEKMAQVIWLTAERSCYLTCRKRRARRRTLCGSSLRPCDVIERNVIWENGDADAPAGASGCGRSQFD